MKASPGSSSKVYSMYRAILIFVCIVVTFICVSILSLPNVKSLEGCITTSMYSVKLCPKNGHYTPLGEISRYAVDAVLAAEDSAFYSHNGFDWHEIQQSFNANLKTGKIHRGGSTITQQLAKNVFLNKEKSYWRKFKEAYLTYALEKTFSKNFILEKYLNVVEFGPNLYGIKDAASHYFNKTPSQLNPLEAVYLAMLLPNPKAYSQSFRKGQLTPFARKMISVLLVRLLQFRKISEETYHYAHSQIGSFPWHGLSGVDFSAPPVVADAANEDYPVDADGVIDEEKLEELLKDELKGMPSAEDEIPYEE